MSVVISVHSIKASARRSAGLNGMLTLLLAVCFAFVLPTRAAGLNSWLGAPNLILPWSDPTNWSLGTVADGSTDIGIAQGGVRGDFSFTNLGTLTLSAPANLFLLSPTTITNPGVIDLFGTLNGSGTLVNTSTGFIDLLGATLTGSGTMVNAGSISAGSGQNVIAVNVNQTATGNMGPGHGATLVLDGAHVTGGSLSGNGLFTAQNGATIQDLNIGRPNFGGGVNLTAGSTLGIQGTVTVLSNLALNMANGATINNLGSLQNQAGGTVSNLGTLNNSGGIANLGTFQIGNGGVLNNTGAIGNAQGGGIGVLSGGTFNNSGSLISDFLSSFGTAAGSSVVNTGTMSLSGNTVGIGGSLRNDGSISLTGGPPLGEPPIALPPPPLFIASTGALSGTGIVNGNVVMQGNISPGDSPGLFTINGNYTQTSSGHLLIELAGLLAGTQYDVLDVHGSATLAGFLDVGLFGGFNPTADSFFDVLLADDLSGTFDTMNLPTSANGVFTISYLHPTGLDAVRISFDFGDNGLPEFPGPTREGLPPPGTQVPEPTTLLLFVSGLVGLWGVKRKFKK